MDDILQRVDQPEHPLLQTHQHRVVEDIQSGCIFAEPVVEHAQQQRVIQQECSSDMTI